MRGHTVCPHCRGCWDVTRDVPRRSRRLCISETGDPPKYGTPLWRGPRLRSPEGLSCVVRRPRASEVLAQGICMASLGIIVHLLTKQHAFVPKAAWQLW